MDRREAIRRMAAGFGGMLAVPSDHPIHRLLGDGAAVAAAQSEAKGSTHAPEFLDAHQLQTVEALAERIVPGSTEAQSAPFIDRLLAVATPAEQQTFLQALGAFEGLAIARASRPWKALSEREQNELLTTASTAAPGSKAGSQEGAHVTIRDRFEHLKGWIVGAYYSSERGMRELGWTGKVVFPSFDGCDHPGGHP